MNLTTLKDEELVSRIRTSNCSDSIVELSRRHQGLVVDVIKRYANAAHCSGVRLEDFLDDANFLVYEAAKKFDTEKSVKFSTWLGNNVRYHCLNTLNKESKYYSPDKEEFTEFLADSIANEEDCRKTKSLEQMEYVNNILEQVKDKRVQQIIQSRYFAGQKKTSFSVIAKELDMSTQGVIDLHDAFITFVQEKMKSRENMDKI